MPEHTDEAGSNRRTLKLPKALMVAAWLAFTAIGLALKTGPAALTLNASAPSPKASAALTLGSATQEPNKPLRVPAPPVTTAALPPIAPARAVSAKNSVPVHGGGIEASFGDDQRASLAVVERAAAANFDDEATVLGATERNKGVHFSGTGCQAAFDASQRELNMLENQAPDVSRESYAASLEDFARYQHCDVPAHVSLDICVAVQAGTARGVTIRTQPKNARVETCVAATVARMRFPASPHPDLVRTEIRAAK
jgi:hypothetical protein